MASSWFELTPAPVKPAHDLRQWFIVTPERWETAVLDCLGLIEDREWTVFIATPLQVHKSHVQVYEDPYVVYWAFSFKMVLPASGQLLVDILLTPENMTGFTDVKSHVKIDDGTDIQLNSLKKTEELAQGWTRMIQKYCKML